MRRGLRFLVGLAGLVFAEPLHGQLLPRLLTHLDSVTRSRVDSLYIRIPHERWMIRPFVQSKFVSLGLRWSVDGLSNSIDYRPNRPSQLGAFVAYRRIGLGLSVGVPGTSRDLERFGRTRHFDAQLFLFSRHWAADLTYVRYQGLFVNNPRAINPNWTNEQPNPQRQDLLLRFVNFNGIWVFNSRRFSLRAASQQMEQQMRGAGSFLLLAGANLFRPGADSTLVPHGTLPEPLPHQAVWGGRLASIGLAPGYGRAFRVWRFFCTPLLFVGPTLQTGWLETEGGRSNLTERVGTRLQFQNTLGYYSERFFMGLLFRYDNVQYQQQRLTLAANQYSLRLFAGWWLRSDS